MRDRYDVRLPNGQFVTLERTGNGDGYSYRDPSTGCLKLWPISSASIENAVGAVCKAELLTKPAPSPQRYGSMWRRAAGRV